MDIATSRDLTVAERAQFHSLPCHKPRPLSDNDVSCAQEFLQKAGMTNVGFDTVFRAMQQRARERSFHPLRDYLASLKWDGEERLGDWIPDYLGAEMTPYTQEIGPMFLVGAVARIFEPGCPMNYALILEGPQGARKSTACRILGGQYFTDHLPDLSSGKDVALHIRGVWFVEIAEMSVASKAEDAALKAFITRQVERYRPAYARSEVIEPRQCVFVGTTNRSVYLRDETGGRRFWPVQVGKIDTERLSKDRDQLFAEAVAKYRAGFRWWPDGDFEAQHIKPEQEARRESDAWEDLVRRYLRGRDIVLLSEVGIHGLGFSPDRFLTAPQRQVAAILVGLGWVRNAPDNRGNRWWTRREVRRDELYGLSKSRPAPDRPASSTFDDDEGDSAQRKTAHNSALSKESAIDELFQ
jgi:predicted P-loop ATPase